MDDDELRRGRPTSHVVYGEDVAILAGDGLFAEAIRLFCERQEGEPARVLAALAELAARDRRRRAWSAASTSTSPRPASSTPTALRELHALKTGRLIAASVAVPLDPRRRRRARLTHPYRRFADELGVLFQIVDDILDVTGSDEELGKPHGSDERHGKLDLRQPLRPRARARAGRGVARRRPAGARREADGETARPRTDHRLHPHPPSA